MSAASFQKSLREFVALANSREERLFQAVSARVGKSIMYGDKSTGAPGQPVRSGALLASWVEEGDFGTRLVHWISRLKYASVIEHNLRGAILRSKVGGFHSVKLTMMAWKRIVREELAKVKAGTFAVFDEKVGRFRDPLTGRFAKAPA